ncbi:MAG: hypothetical protein KDD28_13155, partial [Phaeodactylibacter sp.]|nr:hypothetical protein [Phaeodactylibacter sp.]
LEYLAERGLEERVRRSIHALLEAQKPNPASAAFDDYRMNVVLNELLFEKGPQRKKVLEEEFARYLAAGHQPDFVTFKYLEREQSPLDLLVPDTWKQYFYKGGIRRLGWQSWLWALPAWLLLSGLLWWWQPGFELCDGEEVSYKDMRLCLRSETGRLLLAEFKVRDRIPEAPLQQVESLIQSEIQATSQGNRPEVDTFYQNIAFAFYNQGASLFNQALQAGAVFPLPDSICDYFRYAIRYDSLAGDTAALFLQAALKSCSSIPDTSTGLAERALPENLAIRKTRDVKLEPTPIAYEPFSYSTLFFDDGQPPASGKGVELYMTYEQTLRNYLAREDFYLKNNPDEQRRVRDFFEKTLPDSERKFRSYVENFTGSLQKTDTSSAGIELIIKGSRSGSGLDQSSDSIVERRINILQHSIKEYLKTQGKEGLMDLVKFTVMPATDTLLEAPLNKWSITEAWRRRVDIVDVRRWMSTTKFEPIPEKQVSEIKGPEQQKAVEPPPVNYASFTDPRDGQSYRTISLNGLDWMAANLNYAGRGKLELGVCYDNNEKNCAQYGRLYTWEEAQLACPAGWRLPTDEEWSGLIQLYQQSKSADNLAYGALIEGGKSGFAAALGGYRYADGSFEYLGLRGYFWSATEYSPANAWGYSFDINSGKVGRTNGVKSWSFSCRCVKD